MTPSTVVVAELTWISWLVPGPMSRRVQVRVSAVIEHPVTGGFTDHTRSAPAGRLSVTTTAFAVPGPALLTVMSKPMGSPAFTGPTGLAVLVMDRLGHWTVTLAVDVPEPSLLVSTLAVLVTVVQSSLLPASAT